MRFSTTYRIVEDESSDFRRVDRPAGRPVCTTGRSTVIALLWFCAFIVGPRIAYGQPAVFELTGPSGETAITVAQGQPFDVQLQLHLVSGSISRVSGKDHGGKQSGPPPKSGIRSANHDPRPQPATIELEDALSGYMSRAVALTDLAGFNVDVVGAQGLELTGRAMEQGLQSFSASTPPLALGRSTEIGIRLSGALGPGAVETLSFRAPGQLGTYSVSLDRPAASDSVGNDIASSVAGTGVTVTVALDSDGDGVPDAVDNCPHIPNPDQVDSDGNGVGDACEADDDHDGIPNGSDNCWLVANPDQLDLDGDGVGDACDNCPSSANADQADADSDTVGDVCDACPGFDDRIDTDHDGVPDGCDNCPDVANPGQEDSNANGVGDACEEDCNHNGIADSTDIANGTSQDCQPNGVPDECDIGAGFQNPSSWATFDPGAHGVGVGPRGFRDVVFDGRYIYFAPFETTSGHYTGEVVRYDTLRPFQEITSWDSYDAKVQGLGNLETGYDGAVFDGQYVYFVPTHEGIAHGEVLRYNSHAPFESLSSWDAFDPGAHGLGEDPDGYLGGAFDCTYVYFSPHWNGSAYSGEVLRYLTAEPFTDVASWETFDLPSSARGYNGAVFDGRSVYFAPGRRVARYDTMQQFQNISSWEFASLESLGLYYWGAVFDGRYIYFVPCFSSALGPNARVARLDSHGTLSDALSWEFFDPVASGVPNAKRGYGGGVYDGRFVYFVPQQDSVTHYHGSVLRYDTRGNFTDPLAWSAFDASAAGIGEDPRGYLNAAFDGRFVYFAPWGSQYEGRPWEVLRYDTGAVGTDCNSNGVPDECDLHDGTSHDWNSNGVPDECEPDFDGDGILTSCGDNCPFVANVDQLDTDSDGVGDACDNCPSAANADQADADSDTVGDGCDACPGFDDRIDTDHDGVPDGCDDCPLVANSDQLDTDEDGVGDACDNCPDVPNPAQEDSNGNGIGDACEADCNHNGIPDAIDIANGTSQDCQPNGVPDECDIGGGFEDATSWAAFNPGAQGLGSDVRGYAGATFDGRYVYFAPHATASEQPGGKVLRYDTLGGFSDISSWATFDVMNSIGGRGGYHGALFDGHYVYLVPFGVHGLYGDVIRYDTSGPFQDANSWAKFDVGANGIATTVGWSGAIFDCRFVYFTPYSTAARDVLRYDTEGAFSDLSSWATFDPGAHGLWSGPAHGFYGGVFDGQYVYLAPFTIGSGSSAYYGEVLRFDTSGAFDDPFSWTTYDPGANGVGTDPDGYSGAVFDGKYVYFVPFNNGTGMHGEVLRYDTSTPFMLASSWVAYDPGAAGLGPQAKGYNGGLFDGRYVYFVPEKYVDSDCCHDGNVLRYDTTREFSDLTSWALFDPGAHGIGLTPDGYMGAAFDGKRVYFAPLHNQRFSFHGEVLRYDTGAVATDCNSNGVPDECDLRDGTSHDWNGNGVPDECEPDFDGDGILTSCGDNCPFVANADQLDADSDGVGDVCDNCVDVPNPGQEDSNADGVGDACSAPPDLVVNSVDASLVEGNWQTLEIHGQVSAEIANLGESSAVGPFTVTFFEDLDHNGVLDAGTDNALGSAVRNDLLAGETATVTASVSGTVLFRDNLIYAFVDSENVIPESDEGNNYSQTGLACATIPQIGAFNPVVKFQALRGLKVISTPLVVNLTDDNGDGRIDARDTPDIVFATMPSAQFSGGPVKAVSGDDGHELFTAGAPNLVATLSELAVGDIDGDSLPEIVAAHSDGRHLIAFEHTGETKWLSDADTLPGRSDSGGAIAIANLDHQGAPEIVVGASVYSGEGRLLGDGRDLGGTTGFSGFTTITSVADVDLDGTPEIIAGPSAYRFVNGVLTLVWRRSDVGDGFTGIANFDDDPFAEIVIVGNGTVRILNHDGSNAESWNPPSHGPVSLPGGGEGGAPTIADYNGDGSLEIGVAGLSRYSVFAADGRVLWSSSTQDASSRTTGSTPFDFEGDGSVEVVYRDERFLRVYRGSDGFVLLQMPMRSGTATELPVVADVDNDGNAEIVVCSDNLFGGTVVDTGIYVIEDANDTWVPTRRIWNQHSYHITNVNEDATIPVVEQNNWLYPAAHPYNSYRQNVPTEGSVFDAPDLTACYVRVVQAGDSVLLTARIGNGGAILAGAGIPVSFYEGDPGSGGIVLGTVFTNRALDPGYFEDVSLVLPPGAQTTGTIWVVADDGGGLIGRNRECDEVNNIHDSGISIFGCSSDTDCSDGNECILDSCVEGACVHAPAQTGTPCGDLSDVDCNLPDVCDGSGHCAANTKPQGVVCRPTRGPCDVQEVCDGVTIDCPPDSYTGAERQCRGAVGLCDPPEYCSGADPQCPPDEQTPSGTACGDPYSAICDAADSCDGLGNCLSNLLPPTTVCRPAVGECDRVEQCTGQDRECPPNEFVQAGAPCGDPTRTACDAPDTCDGEGRCEPNLSADGTPCPDGLFCNGQESCWSGVCADGPDPCIDLAHCDETRDVCVPCVRDEECDDGEACTDDACVNGTCLHTPIPDCGTVVYLDIKPGSCPNPINEGKKGVVPMALVGTPAFDVRNIVTSSLTLSRRDGVGGFVTPLTGPGGPTIEIEDAATPFTGAHCACHELGGDGIDDLLLKFSGPVVVETLGLDSVGWGVTVELVVRGRLVNGTAFEASDCIVVPQPRPRGR